MRLSSRNHNGEGGCSGDGRQPRNIKCPRPWDTPPVFKEFHKPLDMRRYFVTDIHRSSDAGAMERDLVEWARRIYTNVLVTEDKIHIIAQKLYGEQLRLLAEKPRRQPVDIDWGENQYLFGRAYITIGASQISLVLVQGEIA